MSLQFVNVILLTLTGTIHFFLQRNFTFELMIKAIQRCGVVPIKLCQWTLSKYQVDYDYDFDIFQNNISHSLKQTKHIYLKSFGSDFDEDYEIIDVLSKSGSVGQVYQCKCKKTDECVAMKVKHPNVDKELDFWIRIFYIFYPVICRMKVFKILKYIEIEEFFQDFRNQFDFHIESKNMKKIYSLFEKNQSVVIPKLLKNSKDIIVMSYENSKTINQTDMSFLKKVKCLTLLNLAIKELTFCGIYHCDLHNGNFGLRYHTFSQIVIYDYGFVKISNAKQKHWIQQCNICYECGKQDEMYELVAENCIIDKKNPKTELQTLKSSYPMCQMPFNSNTILKSFIDLCEKYDVLLKSDLINILITLNTFEKIFQKYLNVSENGISNMYQNILDLYSFSLSIEGFDQFKKVIHKNLHLYYKNETNSVTNYKNYVDEFYNEKLI